MMSSSLVARAGAALLIALVGGFLTVEMLKRVFWTVLYVAAFLGWLWLAAVVLDVQQEIVQAYHMASSGIQLVANWTR